MTTDKAGSLWVTGAGKGIGRALAWEYAAAGWAVAASARTRADLEALVQQAVEAKLPGRIVAFVADVTDENVMRETFAAVEQAIGPLDQVILNAGTHIPNSAATFDIMPFRTLMEINVLGVVNGIAAVLPSFIARRAGHIGVVSSVAGYGGLPLASAYGASKAALINMCESLKPELDAAGVGLSMINPGFVRTPLTSRTTHKKPFMIEADEAARHIRRGMAQQKFEIAFPWPFVFMLKVLGMLPYSIYFSVTRRIIAMKKKR